MEHPYTTGTLGISTRTYNYTYGDANWKDKLTAFDGKAITYDAIGNPLTYDGWTFAWEEGRQLANLSKTGLSIGYKYNSAGIRTQKTVNGVTTKYHLVGDKVTQETNGTDLIYYSYDSTDNLVSMNLNGVEYYCIRNAQGDIIGLFDKSSTPVVSYTYDSWGKLISTTGSLSSTVGAKNPYRYRGYRYDTETGLYYLQSRYYNSEWGRFINADSIVGETGTLLSNNMFAYCMNNPVNNYDPDGHFIIVILGVEVAVEAVLMGIGASVVLYEQGKEFANNIQKSKVESISESKKRPLTKPMSSKKYKKKATNERFYGKPGQINKTYNGRGERFETEIGPDGRAIAETHYGVHGNSNRHKNPHRHKITWDENGKPNFSKDKI